MGLVTKQPDHLKWPGKRIWFMNVGEAVRREGVITAVDRSWSPGNPVFVMIRLDGAADRFFTTSAKSRGRMWDFV